MSPRRRTPPRLYLTRRGKTAIYGVLGATWGSGILWLVVHYFFASQGEFGPEPHPLERWSLALHGAGAFATLLLGGWLWKAHVAPWWDSPNRRRSGIVLIVLGAVLIVSGYLLYYASGDALRDLIGKLHWIVGVLLALPVLVHALRSSRYRNSVPRRE